MGVIPILIITEYDRKYITFSIQSSCFVYIEERLKVLVLFLLLKVHAIEILIILVNSN